jgi:hypothetical protein
MSDVAISELGRVQPVHVAAYIGLLQREQSAPTVKRHLSCVRKWRQIATTGKKTVRTPVFPQLSKSHEVRRGLRDPRAPKSNKMRRVRRIASLPFGEGTNWPVDL